MACSQITSPDNRRFKKPTNVEEWKKNKYFFLHVITHLLYNVVCDGFKKSMVSSLEKLYSGLDLDDATLCK